MTTAAEHPSLYRTEATRLLCAGMYFDAEYRRRVLEELVEHEERPVAPSLGIDAVPVFAHALRARQWEAGTGLALLGLWVAFLWIDLSGAGGGGLLPFLPLPWSLAYAGVCFAMWAGRAGSGRSVAVYTLDRSTLRKALIGRTGRLAAVLPRLVPLLAIGYWVTALVTVFVRGHGWVAVLFPLLLVVPVWVHRTHVSTVMREELGRAAFPTRPRAEPPAHPRYRRIAYAIDREQHAALTIYDPFRPFIGAGEPYGPWSLALELKAKKKTDFTAPADGQAPRAALTSQEIVALIRPRLERLRESAAATSRDRLRGLEIEECVYLPVGAPRGAVSYEHGEILTHLRDSVDEGGEARRHFLRIRVGAWDEQVVVSVLVRVHTQGEMLVLEVAPHLLKPIRPEFRAVDVISARGPEDWVRDGLRAILTSPTASYASGVSLVRTAIAVFRVWLADPEHGQPDGPAASIRELASVDDVSLMQEMDVSRYVKTVQDRIASGVREALRSKGFETGEFEQQIVQVSNEGVFIGSMSGGAVAMGEGATAKSTTGKRTSGKESSAKRTTGG
ncbi:hypothetical protein ACFQVC_06045 [Streptomyces monticola]|uniref:RDD family protein n=1 Tax=Streptomyces monticola TaxID=2666263 RepID=A0ABW2JE55_9ACTN